MGIEDQFENRNILDIISRNRKIEAALNQASKDLAMRTAIFELKSPTKIVQGSFYKINKALEKKVDIILGNLHKDIQAGIQDGIVTHWDMANLKNNKLVGTWAEGIKLGKESISASFNQLNMIALDTFLARTAAGMNLSERVWNLTNGAKDQLELYLASGISTGRSAAEIAGDIKQYLNEPNRLFRRVRKEGKLVLSKAARGYHPGAGIYRSSYKNALRLAKNEINMAYRMSDYTRRQQLPFVTGIEVHLSASHPRLDMCDDLVGKYPKGFIFMTWHVGCLCYTTSIMLNEKDSLKFMKTGKIPKSKYISRIPKRAANWIKANSSKITGYKNVPYFIKDNFTKDFKLKEDITRISVPEFGITEKKLPGAIPEEAKYYATSTREAERYIEEKLYVNAHYKGLKLDYANEINHALVKLKAKYPEIRLGDIRCYDMGLPSQKGMMAHSVYQDRPGIVKGSLRINLKYFDKFPIEYDLNKEIKRMFKEGWLTGENLKDIVAHEMGHNLTLARLKFKTVQESKKLAYALEKKIAIKGISKYGDSKYVESLAEAFVQYNKGGELSEKALKAIQKYMGVE